MQANLQRVGLDTEPYEAHAVAWCLPTVRGEKIGVWTCFKDLRFSNAAISMFKTVKEVTKSDRQAWCEGFSRVCIQSVCLGFWLVEHLQPASDVSLQIEIAISISTGVPKLRIRLLLSQMYSIWVGVKVIEGTVHTKIKIIYFISYLLCILSMRTVFVWVAQFWDVSGRDCLPSLEHKWDKTTIGLFYVGAIFFLQLSRKEVS